MSLILVNKPKGLSSHDVVNRVRRATGEKRVGHGGTLDPNATGLLIIGVGREFTKKLGEVAQGMSKTYIAELTLGQTSTTDDSEGEITKLDTKIISLPEIKKVLKCFTGEQMQTPPIFSAIKLKGKKAYELARKGKEVKLNPRKINIYTIKLVSYDYPGLEIECEVSSGTYIRSLARDIGKKLGTGAYLNNLIRTRVGKYKLEDAMELNDI